MEGGVFVVRNTSRSRSVRQEAPAASLEEAEEAARKLAEEDAGKDGEVERQEYETSEEGLDASKRAEDPSSAAPEAGDRNIPLGWMNKFAGHMSPLEESIFGEYSRARIIAEFEGIDVEAVIDERIEEVRKKYKIGEHILPLYNVALKKGEVLREYNNKILRISKFDAAKNRLRKVTDALINKHTKAGASAKALELLKKNRGGFVVMGYLAPENVKELGPL